MTNPKINEVQVDLKALPDSLELNSMIQDMVSRSTWWERYGVDWAHVAAAAALMPVSLLLLKTDIALCHAIAFLLLGFYHNMLANKAGHIVAHGAMNESKIWSRFWTRVFVEFIGSFPTWMAYDIHIKCHHPHTNILGLGDSSTWKAPFLRAFPYLFIMPLCLPSLTPLIGVALLVEHQKWDELAKYLVIMPLGILLHIFLFVSVSGFSVPGAVLLLMASRAVCAIPYIHINIFQHIGLAMYSQEHRPKRIYQMATGCLNLSRNLFLDVTFGHSLINCHVEHHLFPKLSDNMCLKAKPIVSKFLKKHNLPYFEEDYSSRLMQFYHDYDTLMVKAPPITHFVGIQ